MSEGEIKIMSFGYTQGIPEFEDEDKVCVIDVRDMHDPSGKVDGRDGKADDVQELLREDPLYTANLNTAMDAVEAGKMVVFGDGGGQYRSVGMAEILAGILKAADNQPVVEHRDLGKMYKSMSGGSDLSVDEEDEDFVDACEPVRNAFLEDKTKENAIAYLEMAILDEMDAATAAEDMLAWMREMTGAKSEKEEAE